MNNYCHVAVQIAVKADEPECEECKVCGSQMTEHLTDLLECDNCPYTAFKSYNKCNLGELEDE